MSSEISEYDDKLTTDLIGFDADFEIGLRGSASNFSTDPFFIY